MVADPLLQSSGLALPVNANLVFGRRGSEVELEFHDLTLTRSVRIAGRNHPLSADFTASYAVLLNHTEMAGEWFGIKALVNSTEFDRATGIYQIEPWRDDQIPVVFVHGLASSLTFGLTGQRIRGTTSLGNRLLAEGSDSIKTLQPNNPTLSTTLKLPLRPGVRYHSIIGNHKGTEPLEESTDTVVDYWSAHLEDAASETVVDATHLNILRDDVAIEELRRLLYLHAGLKYDR